MLKQKNLENLYNILEIEKLSDEEQRKRGYIPDIIKHHKKLILSDLVCYARTKPDNDMMKTLIHNIANDVCKYDIVKFLLCLEYITEPNGYAINGIRIHNSRLMEEFAMIISLLINLSVVDNKEIETSLYNELLKKLLSFVKGIKNHTEDNNINNTNIDDYRLTIHNTDIPEQYLAMVENE